MTDANPRPDASEAEEDRPRRERKERVLHTRISQQLAEDIGRMAEDLRVPVSNLVRNVLEEVFSVVEKVTDNVGELIEGVMDDAGRSRRRGDAEPRPDPPEVLGWQPLILARDASCAGCDAPIARGERAYLGVTGSGAAGAHTLCADCLDARRNS